MVSPCLSTVGVLVTAWRRPGYFAETLRTWRQARGVDHLRSFTVALGLSDRLPEMADVINESGLYSIIHMDSPAARVSFGMHRALGEGIDYVFSDPGVDFVVCGEEDILVSDDILEYMLWGFLRLREDIRLLAVCAHNRGGTGWDDLYDGPQDEHAGQQAVRRLPYYNPWGWGISRYHWEKVIRPRWDWDCTSGTVQDGLGGTIDAGYDWNMQKRIVEAGDWRCLVPDASRSQNIGELLGVNSSPEIYHLQRSYSFREHRDPVSYRLEEQ